MKGPLVIIVRWDARFWVVGVAFPRYSPRFMVMLGPVRLEVS